MQKRRTNVIERFVEKYITDPVTDCWIWTAGKNNAGYGQFWPDARCSPMYAHRFAWVLHFGPIPDKLNILHNCDNPSCVNPNHLTMGTQVENMRHMVDTGRYKNTPPLRQGQAHGMHKLSDVDVRIIQRLCNARILNQSQIAAVFQVTVTQINRIHRRKAWTHI